ncbi:MAG: hypothetical protein IT261_08845 [Saprospiraceae bacterium]|nr:hypothetical protein [Saprospiraceae bacterium]
MPFKHSLKRWILLAALGVFSTTLFAQKAPPTRSKTSSGIRAGFNGSLIYPGFRGGLEYPYKRIEFTRFRGKKPPRHRIKDRFLTAEFGFYHHPTFHDNYYLLFGYLLRRSKPNRNFWEFAPALGYSRTFLGGETYHVNHHAGTVTRVKWPGYHYAMLSLGGGMGKAFTPRFSGFSRLSMLIMAPSNNIVYFRPTLEIGVILKPDRFLTTEPGIVSRIKGKQK